MPSSPDIHVVILAAGKGTRMKSSVPKVLHPVAGVPLIGHVLRAAAPLDAASTVVVIGHGGDAVQAALADWPGLQFVVQSPQLGTGHAVLQAEPALAGRRGILLLLYGDVPLLQANTLRRLVEQHRGTKAAATVLTSVVDDAYGYGRIVRDSDGRVTRIVEERDASADERTIREVNSGIYAFDLDPLFDALHGLATDNAQGEYYLTDVVAAYHRRGRRVDAMCLENAAELRGVNSRVDLADLTRALRTRKRQALMLAGVTLEDPETAYIDEDVRIGADTTIGPGVRLTGRTTIGDGCRIEAGVRITDSSLGDAVMILDHSVITDSTIASGASVGPLAHLRPKSSVAENARVGNFVELKNTQLGAGSKANHLTYLGDATIGARVNIGAGTITCNYDGERKHRTVIGDDVFVGSDSQLVAPVTIGDGAYIGAGSSITQDVPADALGVARAHQINKPEWASKRRAARKERS
ncbi:MAG TPA: bifunctional UDP-N-acetylglucosamine diphosphorylase/glucosamine-1-phosphate N-acetyltransferase GlmU [Vicinamibacterales bacterium]|jgi:bifunctional UDP-N-acetylglucosamine pyrophosphorylase/glucosamine-1-phosphate N-acetyltransferase|nr:bifunctional UDP-N-acetylglucosamine diphosphorylase/glucosamine-1-phosphate N-acetyltransferase GlmU [Vicinamibacterales bacterium]